MTIYIAFLFTIYILYAILYALISLIATSRNDSSVGVLSQAKYHWRISAKSIFLFLSFMLLFVLMGFRGDHVGVDTPVYRMNFPIYAELDWKEISVQNTNYEIGYRVLMKIAAYVSSDPAWIIMVTSAIFMFFSYEFIKSNCKDYFFAVILFISIGPYLTAFNTIRQCLAGAICLVGWSLFQKRKLIKATLLFVLAVLFHTTAIIFPVLLFVLYFMPHNRKWYFVVLTTCTAFVAILRPMMDLFLRLFPIYDGRYGHGRWEIFEVRGMIVVWVLITVLCLYQCIRTNWTDVQNHRKFEVIVFSTLYITFQLAGFMFDGLQRMPIFFTPFLILLFEDSLKLFEGRSRQIYRIALILLFSVLFIRSSTTAQYAGYQFFWEG